MHGALALRQEYQLMIGNKPVNAIEYITQKNPYYEWSLSDPQLPEGSPLVHVRGHWFQSTAQGGRAQPYVVSYAFEGHPNQFLAILSMSDLPLTHPFVVSDSQKPGATKTLTMADMVRHAKLNVHVGNPNEVAWTLWFLANYLEPDEKWVDKDGHPWSMEQLVTVQTNAPLFRSDTLLAPCGGTHGLFALACACNSYQQKFGKLDGAWLTARQKLDNHIALARRMQNGDGSFSSEYFKTTGWSEKMGPRFKSSGHMLEWLMMALPPDQLHQQWVRSGVMSVANDLVRWGAVELVDTKDTGAMYHALHALVLYRNRMAPPASAVPLTREAQLPDELKNPVPGTGTPQPTPLDKNTDPKMPSKDQPEATIRLLNPAINKLNPIGNARPLLRPITNSKGTATPLKPGEIPEPPPMSEKLEDPQSGEPGRIPLLVPTKPVLGQPVPIEKPRPAPSEPKSAGATVKPLTKDEGDTEPAPLFGEEPGEIPKRPAETGEPAPPAATADVPKSAQPDNELPPAPQPNKPAVSPSLVPPSLPEPTPSKSPSSSD